MNADKEEDFDEVEHLKCLILLIRYRLYECSAHRLFTPNHEVSYIRQMIDREVEQWPEGEYLRGGTSGTVQPESS